MDFKELMIYNILLDFLNEDKSYEATQYIMELLRNLEKYQIEMGCIGE